MSVRQTALMACSVKGVLPVWCGMREDDGMRKCTAGMVGHPKALIFPHHDAGAHNVYYVKLGGQVVTPLNQLNPSLRNSTSIRTRAVGFDCFSPLPVSHACFILTTVIWSLGRHALRDFLDNAQAIFNKNIVNFNKLQAPASCFV